MKLFILVLGLSGAIAEANTPFIRSSDQIEAIFRSELLWKQVGGPIQSISYLGRDGNTVSYTVSTIEDNKTCNLLVKLSTHGNLFQPEWTVTKVDFTQCPESNDPPSAARRR